MIGLSDTKLTKIHRWIPKMKTANIMDYQSKKISIQKNKMKRVPLSFVILFVAIIINTGCEQNNQKEEIKKTGIDSAAAFILTKEPVNKEINFPAELIPLERAEIYAKVSGYIKKLSVDIGDHVKKG